MHLALKSAMSRIPYTNKVGETLSSIADPAAAYSLRALGGGDPMVARVRRSSDDAEKDFTASDMDSGSVADWVNGKQDTTLPCDVASAAAAYSLRSVNSNYTGSIVRVRRSSDDAEQDFSDVSLIADWVGSGNDGYVTTWYDQSGNDNNATQSTASSQPKIVDGGSICTRNGKPIIKFIQANSTYLATVGNIPPSSSDFDITVFNAMHIDGSSAGRMGVLGSESSGNNPSNGSYNFGSSTNFELIAKFRDLSSVVTELNTGGFFANNTNTIATYKVSLSNGTCSFQTFNNGQELGTTQTTTTTDQSYNHSNELIIGARSRLDNFSDSEHFEAIFYNSDQSANRFKIESNINNHYGLYTNANDGFVTTWYDQSGNSNDATQSAAASQPKIVDSGVYLGKLAFDGSQYFQTITLANSEQPNSIFSVSNTNVAGQTHGIYGTSSSQSGYYRSSNKHTIYSSGTGANPLEGSAYVVDTDYLRFDLFNGANSVVGVNGTNTFGTTGDSVLNRLDIGDSDLSGVNPLNGGIKEFVLYTNDQSANRAAIETNINNYYDIY